MPISNIELVENFCCMHLGINLRKAFLEGVKSVTSTMNSSDSSQQREYHSTDVLVHEYCKLLGKNGVPEYGLGTFSFPDFLEESCISGSEKASYYQLCSKVMLDRRLSRKQVFRDSSQCRKDPRSSCGLPSV